MQEKNKTAELERADAKEAKKQAKLERGTGKKKKKGGIEAMRAASKAGAGGADDDDDEGGGATSGAQAKRAEREAAKDEDRKAAADERDAPRECALPRAQRSARPRTAIEPHGARRSSVVRSPPPHVLVAAGVRRPRMRRSA